jgi:hypothetical protein
VASFILSAAIRAVKSKIGTWRAYENVRTLVPEITREEWAQAVGEARSALAQRVLEATRPSNRVPVQGEWTTITRKSGAQWWQQVEVYIRDSVTGARSVFNVTVKTDTLRSRQSVMQQAERQASLLFSSDPDRYPVAIVGIGYAGTYQIQRPT